MTAGLERQTMGGFVLEQLARDGASPAVVAAVEDLVAMHARAGVHLLAVESQPWHDSGEHLASEHQLIALDAVVRRLAQAYADRPGFRPEWALGNGD